MPSGNIDSNDKLEIEEKTKEILEDQFLVHGNNGPYLMSKDRWPNLFRASDKQDNL